MKKMAYLIFMFWGIFNLLASESLQLLCDGPMEMDLKNNKIILKNNVKGKYGEYTLKCKKLIIYMKKGTKFHGNIDMSNINLVEAQGNVILKGKSLFIKAQWGSYDVEKDIIELRGAPVRIEKEKSIIEAEHVRYDRKTGSISTGGKTQNVLKIISTEKNDELYKTKDKKD